MESSSLTLQQKEAVSVCAVYESQESILIGPESHAYLLGQPLVPRGRGSVLGQACPETPPGKSHTVEESRAPVEAKLG